MSRIARACDLREKTRPFETRAFSNIRRESKMSAMGSVFIPLERSAERAL